MRFDDGAAGAKSHAGAVRLGSKEGIEDLVCLLPGKPYAGIADRDQKSLVFRSLRLDPVSPKTSRRYQSSGISGSPSNDCSAPFTFS